MGGHLKTMKKTISRGRLNYLSHAQIEFFFRTFHPNIEQEFPTRRKEGENVLWCTKPMPCKAYAVQ